jgi:hypothetical protein
MDLVKYRPSEISECILLDEEIKKLLDEIAELRKKKLTSKWNSTNELDLNQKIGLYNNKQSKFFTLLCDSKLEFKTMEENAKVLSDSNIQTERIVLGKNKNEQNIYIGLGAILLILGLYVVIKE